jgi:Tfp pilus assembly protein PilF
MVLLLLVVALPLYAQSVQPDQAASALYDQALSAMRATDYDSAIKLFTQAQQAGLSGATLHYNSGVAHYKLGHYQQAKVEFIKAEDGSESVALVHYNIGLSCYRLNQLDEARGWFRRAASAATEQRLVELADEMLMRLDEGDGALSRAVAKESPWSLGADLLLGFDDNVTLENSDQARATNLEDSYLDLYAAARYQLSGDRGAGYWGQLSASSLQYRQYDAYDYTEYDLGLFRDGDHGPLATRVGARISRSDLGGQRLPAEIYAAPSGRLPLQRSAAAARTLRHHPL